MARFDAQDLCTRTLRLLFRPDADEAFTDVSTNDVLYQYISDAQLRVCELIAWQVPEAAYEPPTQLTTSDGGLTYGFGLDGDGNPIVPLGQIELRGDGPRGIPILPGNDWDDTTDVYLLDTAATTGYPVIRWPGQRSRTFGAGLWCRYVKPTTVIANSSSTVTLKPYIARELIPYYAATFAAVPINMDPQSYQQMADARWYEILANLKNQRHGQGLVASNAGPSVWWRRGQW